MKSIKFIIVALIVMFTFLACNKDEGGNSASSPKEALIFGIYYGECGGETCIETFKLSDGELYEDRKDVYRGGPFDFELLAAEKYELVKDLFDEFPDELLDETEDTFGCPDCGDWGGFYVEWIDEAGVVQGWFIDRIKDDIPSYLHDFIDKIDDKIELINT